MALEDIFRQYYHRLCHFAWQMIQDRDAVQDIVQDAFMAFWNNQDSITDDEIARKNFLYTTVRFACLNYIRHGKVVDKFHAFQGTDHSEDPQVIHQLIRSEVMDEIYRIVNTMPDRCQSVFRLGYLEGLSNEQISDELSISINTVKTQKQRGLKLIKAKLHPEFFVFVTSLTSFLMF